MSRVLAPVLLVAAGFTLSPAAQASQPYRYYQFLQTALRGPNPNSIQLSEFQLFSQGSRVPAVAVMNPQGTFPLNGGLQNPTAETPPNANDNATSTKWLDFTRGPLIYDMGNPIVIDGYTFATANDSPERDPISWNFLGSNDNVTYTLLDQQTNYATTTTRYTYVPSNLTFLPANPQNNGSLALFPIISLQSVSPISGDPAGGSPVSLVGTNFLPGASVTFNGVAATGVQVNSTSVIQCVSPAGTVGSTVDVKVTNANGTTATLTGAFTYLANPAPGVSSVSPNTGPSSGGTPITITGVSFRTGASVQIGGQNGMTSVNIPAANVTVVNATTITCTIPAAAPAGSAGFTMVQVTNSDNTTGGLPGAFEYTVAAPTITSLSPNNAPWNATTSITINGTGFAPNIGAAGSVKFGTLFATNVQWVSATQITANVLPAPANISPTVDVTVTNPDGGTVTGTGMFSYSSLRVPENPATTQPGLFWRYYRSAVNAGPPIPDFTTIQPLSTGIQTTMQPFIAQATGTNPFDAATISYWSVQWTGYVNVPADGIWTFFTASDDGSRLFVGNALVVDNNFIQGGAEKSGIVGLKAGVHLIKIQYAQATGGLVLSVSYQGPGLAKTQIPDSAFTVDAAPVITSVSPSHGPLAGNTAIAITGTGFNSIGTFGDNPVLPPVLINGQTPPQFAVVNSTTINAATPSAGSPGAVPIVLQTITGPSSSTPAAYTYDSIKITWIGANSSFWSDPGNWDLGRQPQFGDTVVLTGAGFPPNMMDISTLSMFGMMFDSTAKTPIAVDVAPPGTGLSFSGLGGTLSVDTASADHTILCPINVNSILNMTIGNNRNLTLSGAVTGTGGINFTGPGKLTLAGSGNTYSSSTTVNNGLLSVSALANGGSPSSVGLSSSAAANLQLNAGAVLQFTGPSGTTDRGMTLGAGSEIIDVGANTLSFGGTIVGAGNLTTVGPGGLLTFGSPGNTYASTTIFSGRLDTLAPGALGSGPVTMNSTTTLGVAAPPPPTTGFGVNGAGWTLNGGVAVVNDVATMTDGATGEARSLFNNTPRSYAAGFTASFVYTTPAGGADGVTFCLQNVGPAALGAGGGGFGYENLATSAAVEFNIYTGATGGANGIFLGQNGAIATVAGQNASVTPVNLSSGNPIKVTITYAPPPTSTLLVNIVDQTANTTFSKTYTGVNLQTLVTGSACYVGFTGATGGVASTQTITGFSYTPTGGGSYPNSVTINGNCTINVNASVSTTATIGSLDLSNNGKLTLVPNAATPVNQNYTLLAGAVTLPPAPSFTVANNGTGIGTLSIGALDDGGTAKTIAKAGAGVLSFSGAATSLVDGTLVNVTNGGIAIGNATGLGALASVDLAAGTTLNVNTAATRLGNLTDSGSVTLNGATLTVGSSNNLSGTFSGTIADGTLAGNLIKDGTGSWTLAGSTHSYSGTTTVNAGTLVLDSTLSASSAINVFTGATLRGTGTASVAPVIVDGTIYPGDTSATTGAKGTLTVGGLIINADGTLRVRASGNSSGVAMDQLKVTGATVLLTTGTPGATLQLGMAVPTGLYSNVNATFLNLTSGDSLTTTFTNITITNQSGNLPNSGLQVNYVDSTNTVQASQAIPSNGQFVTGGNPINPVNRLILNLNGAVTPVTVDAFSVRAEGAGTLIEWRLASEFQNAGFNVYRRAINEPRPQGSGNGWTRINPTLIAGRITDPSAKIYRFYDWAPAGIYEYRLECVESGAGIGEYYKELAGPVTTGAIDASALSQEGLSAALTELNAEAAMTRGAALIADSRKSKVEEVESQNSTQASDGVARLSEPSASNLGLGIPSFATLGRLGEPSYAASVREIAATAPRSAYESESLPAGSRRSDLAAPGILPRMIARPSSGLSSSAAKVVSDNSGVLLVSKNQLPAGFSINRLRVQREGRAVTPLALTADAVVLYAPGYSDDYTDKDAFFLYASNAATQAGSVSHSSGLFAPNVSAQSSAGATVTAQFHDVYFDWNLRPYNYPPYFSSQYLTNGSTQSFTLNASGASSAAGALTVNAWSLTQSSPPEGGTTNDHALNAFVNGAPVGQATWSGGGKFVAITFQIPTNVLVSGVNQIDLVTPELSGVSSQIALLHSLSLDYTKSLAANGGATTEIVNASAFAKVYEVGGLSTAALWVVDARYPDRAALAPYETQANADGSFVARFTAQAGGSGKYLVVPAGSELSPLSVSKRSLRPAPAAQYLATGPNQFAGAIQPLVAAHGKEGIKGVFVDQEQLFDYYNYGRYGPGAIRNAVRATRPQYLLLTGRTTYDYHDYSGSGVDPLCPSYLVSTTFWAQTTSDAMFGDLGRGYAEVKIGRIPANTSGDVSNAVKRILSYRGVAASSARAQITADAFDPSVGDFTAEADTIVAANPNMAWSRNYLGGNAATSAGAGVAMSDAANGGADFLVYNGHGSAAHLGAADPHILDANTVQNWTGNIVFIGVTCTFNWVAKNEQNYRSIPIQALTQPQGGMAASISTTTYMNSGPGVEFAKQLLAQSQTASNARWGDLLLRAQQWAYAQSQANGADASWYLDLSKTECILGDPAMPVMMKGAGASGTTVQGAF
ncbi:MAG TPA: C25 family cysteine peptidase [Planctomycetota bacterium]|nr:C25 family cysteine peptidase [Planctomycetota bacterium]